METQYDDSLLQASENLANVDYDNLDSYGLVSEGRHLVLIERVSGYLHNFKDYTCARAKLKMLILAGPDKGKYVFDDVNLPHPDEKQGNQNRRVLIATRLGLIAKGTKDTVNINWKDLEGKKGVVTVEHNTSTDEKTKKTKTFANVSFAGYESETTWQSDGGNGQGQGQAENWDDI